MKTLAFIKAHNFTKQLVLEYEKIQKSGVDVIIVFDNKSHEYNAAEDSIITDYDFMGETLPVLFTDIEMFKKFKLPDFYEKKDGDGINQFVWYNADYQVYIVRKLFPNYDYYWQIEYDVYCNGESYKEFFDKYKDSSSDLIAARYAPTYRQWWAALNTEWIYNENTTVACCILPIIRVSGRAADFLYNRRLEHAKRFQKPSNYAKKWVYCEVFLATEIYNNCDMKSEQITGEFIETPDVKIKLPEEFDNKLYHPVKMIEAL